MKMRLPCAFRLLTPIAASYCLLLGALSNVSFADETFRAAAFSPATWPGVADGKTQRIVKPISEEYLRILRSGDREALMPVRDRLVAALGSYAGVPEERPEYGLPINSGKPDVRRIEKLRIDALDRQIGDFGWDQAAKLQTSPGSGGKVPRLRVSQRQIQALLEMHEAGLDHDGKYLRHAVAGLDYLLSVQAKSGVFGYPYEPGGPGLRRQAAAAAERGERQGRTMVEREWVIDDLGTVGLNFYNVVGGVTLLYGYALTGDRRYLDSAKRAGEWARSRPLVLNYNYNGFSGILLARLYRVTGEQQWLDDARKVFELGVVPGQMPDGRWFDQHNAKVQYHAILCSQLLEYYLALKQAEHPQADGIEKHLRAALDNLAAELSTYGTNNAHESLSLAALSAGLIALGPNPAWERAANIAVNYVTGPFVDIATRRGGELPEPVAAWLLLRAAKERGMKPVEFRRAIVK